MNFIKLSITRPTVVVVLFTVLIFFGLYTYRSLNLELFPEFQADVISVGTVYPGAGASEVENSVTKEIENALSSLEGMDGITSVSMENYSLVTVKLKSGSNVDLSLQNAQRKINAIRGSLPDETEEPALSDFRMSDLPIMSIGASAIMDETVFST
jgi:HAE1 family hydrophobic/amphiphilic exporter-1